MRCHQGHEVIGLWGFFQFAQFEHPVAILFNLFPDQGLEELPLLDALDGGIQFVELLANGIERSSIEQG